MIADFVRTGEVFELRRLDKALKLVAVSAFRFGLQHPQDTIREGHVGILRILQLMIEFFAEACQSKLVQKIKNLRVRHLCDLHP